MERNKISPHLLYMKWYENLDTTDSSASDSEQESSVSSTDR